jgi:hypothetical protein
MGKDASRASGRCATRNATRRALIRWKARDDAGVTSYNIYRAQADDVWKAASRRSHRRKRLNLKRPPRPPARRTSSRRERRRCGTREPARPYCADAAA